MSSANRAPTSSTPDSAIQVAKHAGPIPAGSRFVDESSSPFAAPDEPAIDVAALSALLDGRWADDRAMARRIAADPHFAKPVDVTVAEHRKLTLSQLRKLAKMGWSTQMLPEHLGGTNSPGGNLAAFEELIAADPSLQIKAGVQWGLFGSAILQLGTSVHHERWLDDVMSLKLPGAFAMTEIGHGSDVSAIGTTAIYDPDAEEFVIDTPFRAATKEFLGNAALDGRAAAVFAQLVTGGVSHGVHCFVVPIRTAKGKLLPGISAEDDGEKGGLNGIDNGRLAFDSVRIPRDHLLDRYGAVAPDGTYSSDIASPTRRFFTMLTTLVQGRVSLDGAAVNAAKLGLGIAVTYGSQRRQFSDSTGINEVTLLDYQQHQRRLFPLIARTYASAFAHEELLSAFHTVFSGEEDTTDNREDLETMAAALKPTSTWLALDTLQECREACGGAGYMAANRLAPLRADMDVYATFEGDNHVLLQLVGKRLLTEYARSLKGMDAADVGRYIANRADVISSKHTPWRRLIQSAIDLGDARRSAASLRDRELQIDLVSTRARVTIEEVSLALRDVSSLPKDESAALVNSHQVELIDAARAHVDLILLNAFNAGLDRVTDEATLAALVPLRDLFALTTIEKNLSWYLLHGLLSHGRARTLPGYLNRLLEKVRPHALDLVAAFGYDQSHWRADISSGIEAERQADAAEHYRRRRAANDAPIDEKVLYRKKRESERKRRRDEHPSDREAGGQGDGGSARADT